MHKGKQDPYAPKFWIPTGFFWPYFVTWKQVLNYANFIGFGLVPGPPGGGPWISEPAENPTVTSVLWKWPITWSSVTDEVRLTIYDDFHLMVKREVIHFQIMLHGSEVSGGYSVFSIPVNIRHFIGVPFYETPYGTPIIAGAVDWQTADYAQGGSPWS